MKRTDRLTQIESRALVQLDTPEYKTWVEVLESSWKDLISRRGHWRILVLSKAVWLEERIPRISTFMRISMALIRIFLTTVKQIIKTLFGLYLTLMPYWLRLSVQIRGLAIGALIVFMSGFLFFQYLEGNTSHRFVKKVEIAQESVSNGKQPRGSSESETPLIRESNQISEALETKNVVSITTENSSNAHLSHRNNGSVNRSNSTTKYGGALTPSRKQQTNLYRMLNEYPNEQNNGVARDVGQIQEILTHLRTYPTDLSYVWSKYSTAKDSREMQFLSSVLATVDPVLTERQFVNSISRGDTTNTDRLLGVVSIGGIHTKAGDDAMTEYLYSAFNETQRSKAIQALAVDTEYSAENSEAILEHINEYANPGFTEKERVSALRAVGTLDRDNNYVHLIEQGLRDENNAVRKEALVAAKLPWTYSNRIGQILLNIAITPTSIVSDRIDALRALEKYEHHGETKNQIELLRSRFMSTNHRFAKG